LNFTIEHVEHSTLKSVTFLINPLQI
jgi:hypothetical protein